MANQDQNRTIKQTLVLITKLNSNHKKEKKYIFLFGKSIKLWKNKYQMNSEKEMKI